MQHFCSTQPGCLAPCPYAGNSVCGRPHTGRGGNRIPQCFTFDSEALPPAGSSELPEFFGRRLQTSMTRATVEGGPAGHTLRLSVPDSGGQHGRSGPNPPNGASSGWWVILPWRPGAVHQSLAHWLPGEFKPRACSGGRLPTCDSHATPWVGAWCGEQRRPD